MAQFARLTEVNIIRANRVNVFGTAESLAKDDWRKAAIYRSHVQEGPPRRLHDPRRRLQHPYMCYYAFPKVIFRPEHFQHLVKGGHTVTLDPPSDWVETGIDIWHFPIRSRTRFIETVDRRRTILHKIEDMNIAAQYRRWISMIDAGISIDTILAEVLPRQAVVDDLIKSGVVSVVTHPIRFQEMDQI